MLKKYFYKKFEQRFYRLNRRMWEIAKTENYPEFKRYWMRRNFLITAKIAQLLK